MTSISLLTQNVKSILQPKIQRELTRDEAQKVWEAVVRSVGPLDEPTKEGWDSPEDLAGVGMAFKKDKCDILVTGLSAEGSAARSGQLYKGSIICKVDGKQVSDFTEQEICSQILGPHGSCVVLTIRVQEGKVDSKGVVIEQQSEIDVVLERSIRAAALPKKGQPQREADSAPGIRGDAVKDLQHRAIEQLRAMKDHLRDTLAEAQHSKQRATKLERAVVAQAEVIAQALSHLLAVRHVSDGCRRTTADPDNPHALPAPHAQTGKGKSQVWGERRRTSMEPPCATPLAQPVSFQYPTATDVTDELAAYHPEATGVQGDGRLQTAASQSSLRPGISNGRGTDNGGKPHMHNAGGGRRRTSMEPPCATPLAQPVSFQYPTATDVTDEAYDPEARGVQGDGRLQTAAECGGLEVESEIDSERQKKLLAAKAQLKSTGLAAKNHQGMWTVAKKAPLGWQQQGRVKGLDVESSPLPAPCFSCHPQDCTSEAGESALASDAAAQVTAHAMSSKLGEDGAGEADGRGVGRMRLGGVAREDKGGPGGRAVRVKKDGDLHALLAERQRQLEQAEHADAGLYFEQ